MNIVLKSGYRLKSDNNFDFCKCCAVKKIDLFGIQIAVCVCRRLLNVKHWKAFVWLSTPACIDLHCEISFKNQ